MRVIGIAGWSGAGKTTLIAALIPHLVAHGLKISTIKHAHHGLDFDQKGKDSHTHRMAGATEVLVSSAARWALVHELRGAAEPGLPALIDKLAPVDMVIIEGFKRGPQPKVEVYREAVGKPLLFPGDPRIVAVASDRSLPGSTVPVLAIENIEGIADLMLARAVPVASLFERAF